MDPTRSPHCAPLLRTGRRICRRRPGRPVTVPKSYSQSLHRQLSAWLCSGEPVAEITSETDISPATLFRWKAQALMDARVRDRVSSTDADELAGRIARLEAALVLTHAACALFDEGT
ncbi:transposase [Nocardia sp. CA-151230]|uniref:transposase n=1 Tax=Nocardia sp. CA-151230 TaxID=3239982 RepID=UPI003D8D0FF6